MAKLYPPYINGTIPAFYSSATEGTKILVPFSMNRAVAAAEVKGMVLKIKSLSGVLKGVVSAIKYDATSAMTATFDVSSIVSDFALGGYYKVQLAYVDKDTGETGYYSTVGVIKYTTKPKVTIAKLSFGHINTHNYSYTGVYSQSGGDASEKLYSSHFTIFDSDSNVYFQSEEKLHDNTTDDLRYEAHESFKFPRDLQLDKSYYIQFIATTSNGMTVGSQKYRIIQRRSINPEADITLNAQMDYDNGYVKLTITDDKDPVISGNFAISRCSNANNWIWEEIQSFNLQSIQPEKWELKDCTVEQGLSYKYGLQQYNDNGIYSNRVESGIIFADFEDAFLYDGERQLKIRYNPKVSSFKTDIQESKSDTIGNRYPFITRNSHIYYKEFPISGLISYLSDEQQLFMTKEELGMVSTEYDSSHDDSVLSWNRKQSGFQNTTNLTGENIAAERIFKLKVLEWLNNGKPKSFRSPGEGNYLVRLMNISLSPNDTLGRMLHTFSCTAYEVGEYSLENLSSYSITDPVKSLKYQRRWVTKSIADLLDDELFAMTGYSVINDGDEENWTLMKSQNKIYKKSNTNTAYTYRELLDEFISTNGFWYNISNGTGLPEIFVEDLMPGSEIRIDGQSIIIGATGSYRVENESDPFQSVDVNLNSVTSGLITIAFEAEASSIFGTIEDISVEDVPCRMIIGDHYYQDISVYDNRGRLVDTYKDKNIFTYLQDVKHTILKTNMVRVTKRPLLDATLTTDLSFEEVLDILDSESGFSQFFITAHGIDEPLRLINYQDEVQPMFELPLYQLRMPRKDYREEITTYYVTNPQKDKQQFLYKDYKPYTFEGYYTDKHNDYFSPYLGYVYDPKAGTVTKITDDLFQFKINDEIIDVKEIETWQTNTTSGITSIELNKGVIGEFSYSQQIAGYQFDSIDYALKDQNAYKRRTEYEKALYYYLAARDGRKTYYSDALKSYVDGFLKTAEKISVDTVNNWIQPLKSYLDNPRPTVDTLSNYLNNDANAIPYYSNIKTLKDNVSNAYSIYKDALEQAIEAYKEANGIEDE